MILFIQDTIFTHIVDVIWALNINKYIPN